MVELRRLMTSADVEQGVSRAERQPVDVPHRRASDDRDREEEGVHHSADQAELLPVFLTEVRSRRLRNLQQLHDDGQNAVEMARTLRAFQRLRVFALGDTVTESVSIEILGARQYDEVRAMPTQRLQIGIGAGPETDGQVLVLHDLWGLDQTRTPRFVRRYADGAGILTAALDQYDADVKESRFPDLEESYQ